jgi:aspartyl-tRNA(Asn)/glutamyl-tRNA(Gln) amidotransferase subunit A
VSTTTWMTAAELSVAYGNGSLSPVEAARAALAHIAVVDPAINAFCHVDADTTLAEAAASETRWKRGAPLSPIDGVPTSIKDLMWVMGWPCRYGSLAESDKPVPDDDPAVAFLRRAGAVMLGKTTTPEYGNSGVTDSPLTGLTKNPWALTHTPGGSSGGAVAAVAAGCGPLALGSDGGGSIRTPASFTNLVGHKPTFGRVPQAPGEHFGRLSASGPITRTVRDAALMMNAMAHCAPMDWHSLPEDGVDHTAGLEDGVKHLRIAYSGDLGFSHVDPEIAAGCRFAIAAFRDAGATVEEADPGFPNPYGWFTDLWRGLAAESALDMDAERRAKLGREMRESADSGAGLTLEAYMRARRARTHMIQVMQDFHRRFDLIVTPAAAVPPFPTGTDAPPDWPMATDNYETFPAPFNATGQPAISVPCGFTRAGLPYGLQIAGRRREDALVLRAARAFEKANPLYDRRPPL